MLLFRIHKLLSKVYYYTYCLDYEIPNIYINGYFIFIQETKGTFRVDICFYVQYPKEA